MLTFDQSNQHGELLRFFVVLLGALFSLCICNQ